jgi:hypothetical protein
MRRRHSMRQLQLESLVLRGCGPKTERKFERESG